MHRILPVLLLLTACASRTTSTPVRSVDDPAKPPVADPIDKAEDEPVARPATTRPACDQEIAIVCAEGFVDGCGIRNDAGVSLTSDHVCVAADATPGPPCAQEIAADCAEGFVDACMTSPALSTGHVCVQAP